MWSFYPDPRIPGGDRVRRPWDRCILGKPTANSHRAVLWMTTVWKTFSNALVRRLRPFLRLPLCYFFIICFVRYIWTVYSYTWTDPVDQLKISIKRPFDFRCQPIIVILLLRGNHLKSGKMRIGKIKFKCKINDVLHVFARYAEVQSISSAFFVEYCSSKSIFFK